MKSYTAKKLFDLAGSASDEVRCELGEGPTWNANGVGGHRRTLSWVDIKKGKLFLWDTISNRINVIFIVHLEEDQLHYMVNLGGGGLLGGGGISSGSGSSATSNGLSEPFLVEGKPTIKGETELVGFAVPVADSEVFLCGSQHGLFYLRTNQISRMSLSVHDDKKALSPLPSFASAVRNGRNVQETPKMADLMDTTALKFSASQRSQSSATIRFYTYYLSMEQYIYALAPFVTSLPKFEPFREMQFSDGTDKHATCPAASSPTARCTNVAEHKHTHTSVAATPHTHKIRFNDAKTDRSGRLFLGTMDIDCNDPIGDLYVLDVIDTNEPIDSNHSVKKQSTKSTSTQSQKALPAPGMDTLRPNVSLRSLSHTLKGQQPTISNGLDWSPCNTKMYYVDSPTRRIDVFNFRIFEQSDFSGKEHKGLSFGMRNRSPFIDLNNARIVHKNANGASAFNTESIKGTPDGLTVDAHGNIWLALWEGGRVLGINPNTQAIFAEVLIPNVSCVTSVCFGGPALSWLVITTAIKDGEPDSGQVFVAEYLGGALGLPATEFKGTAFTPPAMSFAMPKSAAPTTIMAAKL